MSSTAKSRKNGETRIVMVGTSPQTMGGIATVVRGYLDAGLFERVHCEYIVTHRDGAPLRKLGCALRGYFRILSILVRRDRVVFHVHLSSRASFWRKLPIFWLSRLLGRPYIIHLHGSEFMAFFSNESGALAQSLIRSAFDHAALILALSPEWKENISSITRNARVTVFPNGVTVADSFPERPHDGEAIRLLFLGRLGWRKGIYDVLAALREVCARQPGIELVAAGDGEIEEVKARASEFGLSGMVRVPGWIDPRTKRELLASADVFVLPSHAEGLPMSLLEAMAAGLAVVCSDVGGIPLAIDHEREGLLIPAGDVGALRDALLRVIEHPELRIRLGRDAHARARADFSVQRCVNELVEIYAKLGVRSEASPVLNPQLADVPVDDEAI